MTTEDVITEDIALALSDLQRASRYAGEMAHQPGAGMAEREEREARKDAEREISDVILRARRERDEARGEYQRASAEAGALRAERDARFTAEEVLAVYRDGCWDGGSVNRVSRDVMEMSARVRRRAYDAFHAANAATLHAPEATP